MIVFRAPFEIVGRVVIEPCQRSTTLSSPTCFLDRSTRAHERPGTSVKWRGCRRFFYFLVGVHEQMIVLGAAFLHSVPVLSVTAACSSSVIVVSLNACVIPAVFDDAQTAHVIVTDEMVIALGV
eukprot:26265-Rhodomonas_salina.2